MMERSMNEGLGPWMAYKFGERQYNVEGTYRRRPCYPGPVDRLTQRYVPT